METTIFVATQRRIGLRGQMILLVVLAMLVTAACSRSATEQNRDVAVNAPASGVVRRILVSEGAAVEKDAAIIEIALEPERARAAQPNDTNTNQAERAAKMNLASAEGEANRTTAELRRIEPLVKRGLASRAELDKARAQALDARERLELAREKAHSAAADRNQPASIAVKEEIVTVRVPVAGTVRVLNVQAGQKLVAGQPVATVISRT